MMPVPPVARQPRRLDAVDGADVAGADQRHQPLEPRPLHPARSGAAEVVVDHRHRGEARGLRRLRQVILPALAFEIADDLRHGRLANVDDGGAGEMISGDLAAHRRLPCSSTSCRPSPGLPAEDRPGPRPVPACLCSTGTGRSRRSSSRTSCPRLRCWLLRTVLLLLVGRTGVCAPLRCAPSSSKHGGQLVEPLDADLRRPERHADAIAFVEHPVRQLAAQIRPLLRVDARQRLAAPERRDLQRSSEQRMPAIGNGRESKTVCRMSVAGRGGHGTETDARRTDRARGSAAPAPPARRSLCACRPAPATDRSCCRPASRSASARRLQRRHQPMQRRWLDIAGNPQPAAIRQRNLDQRGTDRRRHSRDGRGAASGDDSRSGPASAAIRTGTKTRVSGNAPNAPSRASFRHLNNRLLRKPCRRATDDTGVPAAGSRRRSAASPRRSTAAAAQRR